MPAHKKYLTEEDKKRAVRESYIKYNMSEKGKARSNNFKQTITDEFINIVKYMENNLCRGME